MLDATTPLAREADLLIVGGGAAGLMASIAAQRHRPGWRIVLLDGAPKLGAKILASGGGRCNVTHETVREGDYNGGPARCIRHVLRAFNVEQTLAFFESLGVALRLEAGGKLFPTTGRATTVRDALVGEVRRLGVEVRMGARVSAARARGGGFAVDTPGGAWATPRLLLATGGRSYPRTGSDGSGFTLAARLGHTIVPTTPALVPLVLEGEFHRPLSGLSHPAALTVAAVGLASRRLVGDLLWTRFGISGPVVLDASRHWLRARLEGHAPRLLLSLLPTETLDTLEAHLLATARQRPRAGVLAALSARVPRTLIQAILAETGLPSTLPLSQMGRSDRQRLLRALVERDLHVRDSRGYDQAEVTAGGVRLEEVLAATLASRLRPGLFFAGEILDVDGRLGGFNFQWAWSSAQVAARGAALYDCPSTSEACESAR